MDPGDPDPDPQHCHKQYKNIALFKKCAFRKICAFSKNLALFPKTPCFAQNPGTLSKSTALFSKSWCFVQKLRSLLKILALPALPRKNLLTVWPGKSHSGSPFSHLAGTAVLQKCFSFLVLLLNEETTYSNLAWPIWGNFCCTVQTACAFLKIRAPKSWLALEAYISAARTYIKKILCTGDPYYVLYTVLLIS